MDSEILTLLYSYCFFLNEIKGDGDGDEDNDIGMPLKYGLWAYNTRSLTRISSVDIGKLSFFLSLRGGTCPLHVSVLRPALRAGQMHDLSGGTSVV